MHFCGLVAGWVSTTVGLSLDCQQAGGGRGGAREAGAGTQGTTWVLGAEALLPDPSPPASQLCLVVMAWELGVPSSEGLPAKVPMSPLLICHDRSLGSGAQAPCAYC